MNPIARSLLPLLLLVSVTLPGATVTSDVATAAARLGVKPAVAQSAACLRGGGRACRYAQHVLRAGRVTVVKTTWALGRVLEHGFDARRAPARPGR